MIVISPLSADGFVSSQVYDHARRSSSWSGFSASRSSTSGSGQIFVNGIKHMPVRFAAADRG
jgi:hypothetical protein